MSSKCSKCEGVVSNKPRKTPIVLLRNTRNTKSSVKKKKNNNKNKNSTKSVKKKKVMSNKK